MATTATVRPAKSSVRWTICALLFFGSTINYVDRQVLSLLAKTLQDAIGWTNIEYSNITSAFTAAYALGMLASGRLLDKYGARIGYGIAVTLWSLAAMGHAAATSALGFGIARVFLGLGEAPNFPAAIKVVAQWFPKKSSAQIVQRTLDVAGRVVAVVAMRKPDYMRVRRRRAYDKPPTPIPLPRASPPPACPRTARRS